MIDAPTFGRTIAPASKAISLFPPLTIAAAFLFQAVGLYAAWATFGAWNTGALYVAGGLTVLLQLVVARRRAGSC